jgi:hypothetical protein
MLWYTHYYHFGSVVVAKGLEIWDLLHKYSIMMKMFVSCLCCDLFVSEVYIRAEDKTMQIRGTYFCNVQRTLTVHGGEAQSNPQNSLPYTSSLNKMDEKIKQFTYSVIIMVFILLFFVFLDSINIQFV